MKNIFIALLMLMGVSTFAADDQATGTITFTGALSPKVFSVEFAVIDCGANVDLATCTTGLDTAVFAGHSSSASLALGNLNDGNSQLSHFVQFEAKIRTRLLANDYMQFIAGLTSSTNDIQVRLRRLTFVSGGFEFASFGQTTLGSPGVNDLATNEAMLSGVDILLGGTTAVVYDQSTDNPSAVNTKVFAAGSSAQALTLRGILEVTFGETATSSAYSATVEAGIIAKDN